MRIRVAKFHQDYARSGSRCESLARGAPWYLAALASFSLLIASPFSGSAASSRLLRSLPPPADAGSDLHHGWSVAIDGNMAVIGAPWDSTNPPNAGAVRIYDVQSGIVLHTLVNPDPEPYEEFGTAVAISRSRVAVGAPRDNSGALAAGSAYLYDVSSNPPALLLTLRNPAPGMNDSFGQCVAISGDWLVVGAPYHNEGFHYGGTVFVYNLAETAPVISAIKLSNPGSYSGEEFGMSVGVW